MPSTLAVSMMALRRNAGAAVGAAVTAGVTAGVTADVSARQGVVHFAAEVAAKAAHTWDVLHAVAPAA